MLKSLRLLCAVLAFSLPGILPAQSQAVVVTCEQRMQELSAILTQVKAHCDTLRIQLLSSQTNLKSLAGQLIISSANVTELQSSLQNSEKRIAELETNYQMSSQELARLREQLMTSTASLTGLQSSLEVYRKKAESEIKLWRGVAIAAPLAVVAVWVVSSLIIPHR
jgi:chromosome segregation ATPase